MTRTAPQEFGSATATSRHAARDARVLLRDLPEFATACTRMPSSDGAAKVKFDVLTPRAQRVLDASDFEVVTTRYAPRTNRVFVILDR